MSGAILSFGRWVHALDEQCINSFGMSFHDMPDLTMVRALYDDGCSPTEAWECCCEMWAQEDSLFAQWWSEEGGGA